MHGVDEGWQWVGKPTISSEAEDLIRSDWADRTAYGIAGQNPEWHNYVDDLAQEARLTMWQAASKFDTTLGGNIVPFCKQRGRWAILKIITHEGNFTGQERVANVTQKRGDEARDRLKQAEQEFFHHHGRPPSASEVAAILGITERTVYKHRRAIRELPGQSTRLRDRSLETLIDELGAEGLLKSSDRLYDIALAYHYGEIYQALNELPDLWREYIYLRFWEGLGPTEIVSMGVTVSWRRDVRPVLAEKLHHLATAT